MLQASFLQALDEELFHPKAAVKTVTLFLNQENYYIMYQMFCSLKKVIAFCPLCLSLDVPAQAVL